MADYYDVSEVDGDAPAPASWEKWRLKEWILMGLSALSVSGGLRRAGDPGAPHGAAPPRRPPVPIPSGLARIIGKAESCGAGQGDEAATAQGQAAKEGGDDEFGTPHLWGNYVPNIPRAR